MCSVLHAVSDSSEPCGGETWPLRGTQIHHDKQALTGKAQDITQSKGLLSMPERLLPADGKLKALPKARRTDHFAS